MPDLNDMAVFAHVVREGGFTRAARALGIPKSTVSHRIARLEARLGVTLLQRTTRAVRCTDTGRAYYERCALIVAEAQAADAAAAELGAKVAGPIRLCVPVLFGHAALAPVIAELLRTHPGVSLHVTLRDGNVDPVKEGFDVAVRVGPVADGQLVTRRLGTAHHLLCASPGHLREKGTPRTPADLEDAECIVYEGLPVVPPAWPLERGREKVSIRARGRLAVDSVELAHRAALEGTGIASLPPFVCDADLRSGRLVTVLPDWRGLEVPIRLLVPGGRAMTPRVRALVDVMVRRYTAQPPWGRAP